ncbi:MAG: carbohydrate ABC transporter permease, partial [Ruthenibacterium sp.]
MIEKRSKAGTIAVYIALIIIAFVTLLPFVWMLSASLKLESQVFSVPIKWIPENPQWSNYAKIWEKIPLGLFTFNSMKLTAIITIIQLITSSFAAYGFSKCKFRGRDTLFLCYIVTIAI